jgi:hypothetical protein
MTQFLLSPATQNAINTAINDGPGLNNANYVAAYNAIYTNLVSEGGVNAATLYWFSQTGNINGQVSKAIAAGTFIWAYTEAAAKAEGYTVTPANLQAASDAIALKVFTTLQKSDNFLFSDANVPNDFGSQQIIKYDAGAGIGYLQTLYPKLDYAVWGGTLFAIKQLNDPTYLTDYGISILPFSMDSFAIVDGFLGGAAAVATSFDSGIIPTGFASLGSVDWATLVSALGSVSLPTAVILGPVLTWKFLLSAAAPANLSSLSTNTTYVYDSATGAAVTLLGSNSSGGGDAITFNPTNDTAQITNFVASGAVSIPAGSDVTAYTNGSATDTTASIAGVFNATVPMAFTNFGAMSGQPYGLVLAGGSSVTNGSATDPTASISGSSIGILMGAGTNSVANFAKIIGGVEMNGAGQTTITNGSASDPVASITAGGIYSVNVTTVANFGSVAGGMSLTGGSSVTNGSTTDFTALISAEVAISSSAPGKVVNYGTIDGGTRSSAGVSLSGTGSVTNGSVADPKALISGDDGIVMGSANVTNYGTITGTNVAITGSGTITNAGVISNTSGAIGSAITFQPGTNRLVEDPGSVIIGQVSGLGSNTLELASGSSAGSIGGLGTGITGFGTVAVDTGASWTFSGTDNVANIVNNGFINIAGSLDVSSAVDPTSSGVFFLTGQSDLEIAAILGGGN